MATNAAVAVDPLKINSKLDDTVILRAFDPPIELRVVSRLTNKDGTLKRKDFVLSEDQAPRIILLSINGQTKEAEITWNGVHQYKPINSDGQIVIYHNMYNDADVLHFCQACLMA